MRYVLVAMLVGAVLALPAAPLAAGEEPTKPEVKPEAEAEAPPPSTQVAPVRGEKVLIRLNRGVVLRGVVRYGLEVMVGSGFRPATSQEEPGAGVRLYYSLGLDGYFFVPFESIAEIEFTGKLSEGEGRELARRLGLARVKAVEDRERARLDLEAKKAAARLGEDPEAQAEGEEPVEPEAAGEPAEAEEPPAEEPTAMKPSGPAAKEPTPEELEREKKIAELLEEFPPPKWLPDRLEDIKRDLLMELEPTEKEQKFTQNYELWFVGYKRWLREQATAKEDATE